MPALTPRTLVASLLLAAALVVAFCLRPQPDRDPSPAGSSTDRLAAHSPAGAVNTSARPDAAPAPAPERPSEPRRAAPDVDAVRLAATTRATNLRRWVDEWHQADPAARSALAATGRTLAAAHRAALKDLIPLDPQLALELAVPAGQRVGLPPDIDAQLERRIDTRGTLDVAASCFGPVTRIERTAVVGGERLEVAVYGRREAQHTKFGLPMHGIAVDGRFALSETPYRRLDAEEAVARGLPAGAIAISVAGELRVVADDTALAQLEHDLVAAESRTGPQVVSMDDGGATPASDGPTIAANTPWILGAKRVLWVQVDFSDDPGTVATPQQIEATNTQVSAFYAAVSQGKTTMSFTTLPATLRLPREKSVYNASSSSAGTLQADAAVLAKAYDAANGAAGTYDPDRYDRWIVVFNRMPAYSFGGQAQLTGPQVRMNGGVGAGTVAHELGHTQGLSHSHYWLPSGNSAIGAGAHVEYGDVFDAMGSSGSSTNNHFNAPQKSKIGYLDTAAITSVTTSGTYRIARHDHTDAAGVRALRIAPADLGYEYWLEHRQFGPTAFNSAQLDRLRRGVILHWGIGRAPRTANTTTGSYLVDATPGSSGNANDAPLRIGDSFVDPDAGVTIKPLSTGGTSPAEYLDVQVSFGAVDGNRNPVLAFTPPAGPLNARTNLILTASATDPDGDPLYYRWDFGDGTLQPNLDNITRRFTKGGSYSLRVSAHDGKGGIAARSVTLDVVDPLVNWTRRGSGLTANFLGDVIFAAGRFVVVGDNVILTSPDGTTWTRVTANTVNHTFRGVANRGTRFVAVGLRANAGTTRGGAYYSDGGDNWTVANMPATTGQILGVASGANRFVAVGELGRIYTSEDGAEWTQIQSAVNVTLRGVVFEGGQFVIHGDNGTVLASADGRSWTTKSVPSTATVFGISYYNGLWIGTTGSTVFYTATDLGTWTRRVSTPGTVSTISRFRQVAGLLVATNNTNGSIAFAESVQLWETHQLDATANTNISSLAEGNGVVVAVGSRGLIWSTTVPPTAVTPLPPPTLRNDADSIKVSVGRPNILSAGGTGFVRLELYANGTKVSELAGTAGALTWTPAALGTYSLVVRGIEASGASVLSAAVPAVAGLAHWGWRNPLPAGVDLRSAVRVGSKWWIVGSTGTFLTLDDRGNVDEVEFPTTQHLTGIAYGDGRFVVSGPYYDAGSREEIGSLLTSTDGYSWTPLLTTVFDNFNLNFVAFNTGTWITASTGGLILTSGDGVTWTRQISGVSTSLRSGAFGGGSWVIVGNAGRILTSPNGVTWTTRTSGVTTDLVSVAFDRGQFIAVGASGVILTSPDGTAWTRRTSSVTTALNAIGSFRGVWVAAGDASVTLTSADGIAWTAATMDNKSAVGTLFVGGSGDAGLLLGRVGEIFTASTPSAWRRLTQGTGESRLGVIYAGGRFVAVGQNTDPVSRATGTPVWTSTDGVTWTRANGNLNSLAAVAYGQNRYVALGANAAIYTSTDALTWATGTANATAAFTCIAAGPNLFVGASSGAAIYSSPTGTTWTQRASGLGGAMRAAAYGAGRFVVVGDGGRIQQSADGTTWVAATSGITTALQTVIYVDDVGFLAAGDSGIMLNSTDGLAWTPVETGISDSITAIASTPIGLVAAGGANGTLITSLDGSAWSVSALPANRIVRGLASSGSTIVAVGDQGTVLSFELRDSTPAPTIATAPATQTVVAGAAVTLTVEARNATGAVYQWFKDSQAIPGANTPSYTIPAITSARAGSYTVAITSPTGTVTSTPAAITLGAVADPARLINLSILTPLAEGEVMTMGTALGGAGTSGSKPLLIRAVGPSLGALGVSGTLPDPRMIVNRTSVSPALVVANNDDWGGSASLSNAFASVGAFPYASTGSKDAAVFNPAFAAGNYTVEISGNGAGTMIAEIYDSTPNNAFTATTPRLVNVSVLKQIGAGESLTAGFVVGGTGTRRVLIRAVGPGLAALGVGGTMPDPQLALNRSGVEAPINANNDWGGTPTLSAAFASVGAFALPANSKDAAILVSLAPGNYTAQVTGSTGLALVEVYEVP
ncbi:MAG: PKD domain-containing protein [Verrucomicrobia bacterium]|nr:PKD domain-containing protein [Verrucomicrobiota bacterium]